MNLYTSPSLSSDNNYVLLHRSATGCCTDRGMRMFSSLICKDIGETWTVCFALISSNIGISVMALGAGWWASPDQLCPCIIHIGTDPGTPAEVRAEWCKCLSPQCTWPISGCADNTERFSFIGKSAWQQVYLTQSKRRSQQCSAYGYVTEEASLLR